ncbi:uncharacterized protein UTRI_06677_B [Ustilago trichophora]|uniref:DUF333 domain-containing protein n=1 Tax=Ustilago trichophora TaxID=86804 RepID=A0A5C3EMV3_9BASI|nr:uncharacterized protein UTRI_06677_B [Ustilago trichophora]
MVHFSSFITLFIFAFCCITMTNAVQIANPASEYCIQQGGTLQIVKDAQGNEVGMCKLPDGTVVEEWAFFRSQNDPDYIPETDNKPASCQAVFKS